MAKAKGRDGLWQKRGVWFLRVPMRSREAVKKSTGTRDKKVAAAMLRVLGVLRDRHEWGLLEAVTGVNHRTVTPREGGKPPLVRYHASLTLLELYEAFAANALDDLKARLTDVDLTVHLEGWQSWLRTMRGVGEGTAERYLLHLRTLMPEGEPFPRSELTRARVTRWLSQLQVANPTRRKYHAALSSFCTYSVAIGALQHNLVRDVQAPPPNPPRQRYLSRAEVLKLVEAQPEPYRTLSALMHGTGIEISAALSLTRADVDDRERAVHARGTKNAYRDRICLVDEWAWAYLERHMATLLPNAPLFPGIDRWAAGDAHRSGCKVAGVEGYRMHDARHTYAVTAIKAGAGLEHVAEQLGHADTQMVVKVYGRHRPNLAERRAYSVHRTHHSADEPRSASQRLS